MKRRPVILDADPGVDDFFAWMLLNSSEQFDLRAVTTVPGNETIEKVTRNAQGIYRLFRMKNTRLAKGAPRFMLKWLDIHGSHGATGLADVVLPTDGVELDPYPAWDVIYQEAVRAKGELELIAVGPLTNLGMAFFKYPDLPDLIKRIIIMGGTTLEGNMSPLGEANIYHDPHAAKIVFDTGCPITMVGFNALDDCWMTKDQMEALMPDNLWPELRKDCLRLATHRKGFPFCDAITVAAVMDENFSHWEDCAVEVETRSELTWGMTVCSPWEERRDRPLVKVALDSNGPMFFEMFREMFTHYCG